LNTAGEGAGSSAVDATRIRHLASEYHGKRLPWLEDQIKTVAPEYPIKERAKHHVGGGWFRLILDLNTGVVTKAELLKSTGYRNLDDSALQALRYWRWKPGNGER
jgi:TonB family protein